MRCCLISDHGSEHDMRPAHRLLWERFYGVPPPSRAGALRPKNGDWLDLRIVNWHIVSRKKIRESSLTQLPFRFCKECDEKLSPSEFYGTRKVCKKCYSSHASIGVKNRRNHTVEYACIIRKKKHYHLVDPDQARELMFEEFFDRLHEQYPHPINYKLAFGHYRDMLRRIVESVGKETPDAKPD